MCKEEQIEEPNSTTRLCHFLNVLVKAEYLEIDEAKMILLMLKTDKMKEVWITYLKLTADRLDKTRLLLMAYKISHELAEN